MYVLEYLIYHLRPYGVSQNIDPDVTKKVESYKESNVNKTDESINKTQSLIKSD